MGSVGGDLEMEMGMGMGWQCGGGWEMRRVLVRAAVFYDSAMLLGAVREKKGVLRGIMTV